MLLTIKDFSDREVLLKPSVGLYEVQDFMGKPMPGLAIILDRANSQGEKVGSYAVLTKSFGEFIGIKNCAYVDTNNCYFAQQLLDLGIADETVFLKSSGFCQYPL